VFVYNNYPPISSRRRTVDTVFGIDSLEGEFVLFGTSHIIVLVTLVVLNVLMVVWQRRAGERAQTAFRYALAALLIGQEISLNVWRLSTGTWSAARTLPLHLCGVAIILSAITLVTKSYHLFEICYFWGLAGAIQPLLTPDSTYGFPHYRFFQVFISHGAIVTASVYMTLVVGYRPTLKSLWKAFVATNVYMLLIAPFNLLVGGPGGDRPAHVLCRVCPLWHRGLGKAAAQVEPRSSDS
jgi:hypothetical integral membrane protein (TIGR02206 family)